MINIDKEFGNFEVKPFMGSLTLDHYLLLEFFLDLASQIPLKQNIFVKRNIPELPNFEEKNSNIKVICEVIQIGHEKPQFHSNRVCKL